MFMDTLQKTKVDNLAERKRNFTVADSDPFRSPIISSVQEKNGNNSHI